MTDPQNILTVARAVMFKSIGKEEILYQKGEPDMSRSLSPLYSLLCLTAMGIVLMSSACSKGAEENGRPGSAMAPGTGDVAFRLVWQQPASKAKVIKTPSFNSCVDYAISTIAATISDGTTSFMSASWSCSAHEGLIVGVPAGTNFTIQVNGISSGSTLWSGSASPITVTAGQTTDIGSIVMGYVGGDATKPTVISIDPNSSSTNTTSVPITDRFSIAFDKAMAISTITATNIKLINSNDTSIVSGIVNYVMASNVAAFIPSADLAPNTPYVLQVISCVTASSCITDTAGNQLASDYTNTFTTEPVPSGVPAAPLGVTATPGNGQVTLDWLASSGSTSYNVYYGSAPGVTTTTGTPVVGVRAPAVHMGLTNNTTYYYILTAVNSFGESLASAEVSATPVFPAGDPSPPASLTVTHSSGQNSIAWPSVTDATSYNLYWSTMPITPDKYSADNVVRGVTSPYTHSGLAEGLPYCYIVTALNSNGESADSMQACGGSGSILIVW
jgi:Bacterial Ig-like domain